MREILFRGKRVDDGEWIEGGYFVCLHEGQHCPVIFNLSNGVVKVDGNTVCQLTGLTDKNGTKIFEGDICRTKYSGKYGDPNSDLLVCTDFNDFIYLVLYSEDHSGLNGCMQSDLEVIGNIHDNPELVPNQNNDL